MLAGSHTSAHLRILNHPPLLLLTKHRAHHHVMVMVMVMVMVIHHHLKDILNHPHCCHPLFLLTKHLALHYHHLSLKNILDHCCQHTATSLQFDLLNCCI